MLDWKLRLWTWFHNRTWSVWNKNTGWLKLWTVSHCCDESRYFFHFSQHYNERLRGYAEMNFNRNILLKIIYPVPEEVTNKPCLRHDCDHKSFNHHWQRSCKTNLCCIATLYVGFCFAAMKSSGFMLKTYRSQIIRKTVFRLIRMFHLSKAFYSKSWKCIFAMQINFHSIVIRPEWSISDVSLPHSHFD